MIEMILRHARSSSYIERVPSAVLYEATMWSCGNADVLTKKCLANQDPNVNLWKCLASSINQNLQKSTDCRGGFMLRHQRTCKL